MEKFIYFINILLELFKILMATMLYIFVPQKYTLNDLKGYNIFVLVFNVITLIAFLIQYIFELYNEYKKNDRINKLYKDLTESLGGFIIFNFIITAVLVFHYSFLDYLTATVLISNFLLVSDIFKKIFELNKQ